MSRKALWAVLGLVAGTTPALAHPGHGEAFGFGAGLSHPLGGLDHMLAMVAVGLLAGQIGGRAIWALPLAFLLMMTAGGALGMAGIELPFVEAAIALSVVAFGAATALRLGIPTALAALLVGGFAIFHGQAHGAEMPAETSAFGYAAGFLAATAFLHAVGVGASLGVARLATPRLAQAAGGGVALAGLVLLAKLV